MTNEPIWYNHWDSVAMFYTHKGDVANLAMATAFMNIAIKNPDGLAALGTFIGRHKTANLWSTIKDFDIAKINVLAYIAKKIIKWVDSGVIDELFIQADKEKEWWLDHFNDHLEAFVWSNKFNEIRNESFPDNKWEKKAFAEADKAVKDLINEN